MTRHTQKLSFRDVTHITALAANLMAEMARAYESKEVGMPAEAAKLRTQIAELWAPIADAKKSISETVAPRDSMLPQEKIKGFEDATAAKLIPLLTVFGNNLPGHARTLLGKLGVTQAHRTNNTSPNSMAAQLIGYSNSSRGLGYTGTSADSTMAGNIGGLIEAERCAGPRPRSTGANHGVSYMYDFSNLCSRPNSDNGDTTLAAATQKALVEMGSR